MAPRGETCGSKEQNTIIAVRTLGTFSLSTSTLSAVFSGDDPGAIDVGGRARRIWSLIAYLIIHRDREVPVSELVSVLWKENQHRADPLKTLQHNVSRARDLLVRLGLPDARGLIVAGTGCYRWNPHVNTVVDFEVLQSLANRADEAKSPQDQIALLYRSFSLYGGDVIPGLSTEPWLAPTEAQVLSQYVVHSAQLARLLEEDGKRADAIRVCEQALRYAPTSEEICIVYLRLLCNAGCPEKAEQVYRGTCQLLSERLKKGPSVELTRAYERARVSLSGEVSSLDDVKAILGSASEENQPQECSLHTFRSMIRREALNRERTAKSSAVLVVGVSSAETEEAVQSLEAVLTHFLRRGDAYTRLSAHQFAVLLPELGEENAEGVMSRLRTRFETVDRPGDAAITTSWLPSDAFLTC